ncbi:SH3 domain containing protein [Purpureocillium lavendulum]|uniref:SH3 domain containing protein n=1 Tax=Purpureocillium lavendulum TaxID=1247861 RepID=A0AB34FYV4_9HYPO|nr:SH3 domain containing protein [Purpureocillium lavendulum]
MPRGRAPRAPARAANARPELVGKDREAFEMRQYELILQLRDTILSGRHPTIRLPKNQDARGRLSSDGSAVSATPADADRALQTGGSQPSSRRVAKGKEKAAPTADVSSSTVAKPIATGNAGFNPVLLEKSEGLVQAELAIQRQRLERALKDEVDRRRGSKVPQAERQNTDLDLSDVLTKAQALVPVVEEPPSPAADVPVEAGVTDDKDAASDSFDDDTFYSSQHETPQSQMTSRIRNASEASHSPTHVTRQAPAPALAEGHPPLGHQNLRLPGQPAANMGARVDVHPSLLVNAASAIQQTSIVPGLNNYVGLQEVLAQPTHGPTSGEQSSSDDSANMEYEPPGVDGTTGHVQQQTDSYMELHPPSPLVRSHALQPVAPQPSQVSALAFSAQDQAPAHPPVARTGATPAQVVALRNEHSTATSPDSSSQGGKGSEKKKGRKKKRKAADRQAPGVDVSPYIKPEPRSPSPIFAPAYIRANKRQRQSQARVVDLEYEPRFEPPPANGPEGPALSRPYRDERMPPGYEGAVAYPQRAVSNTYLGEPRYVREYVDDRRIPPDGLVRSYGPQSAMPMQYSPSVGYTPRQAPLALAGDSYREPARSYGEFPGGRVRVAPDGESFGLPPRPAPPRMVVDEHGREYYDPSHPAIQRPMASSVGPGEPGVVYERLPPRTASRQAPEAHGDVVGHGGPAPPAYAVMPRRVVTQPEYAGYDYRDSRGRDYSARPMAPPGGFVEVAGSHERRYFGEAPGHVARAASMMPVDPVRYEMPPYGRVQSVRPEMPGREYAASVHLDSHRELAQPYVRSYGAPPVGDYRHPSHAPPGGEIAFIERPRGATQEIVYADDARREIYR